MILIIVIIILKIIIIVEIIVTVIAITKIKVIKEKKKSVIRTGEWNNLISLFVILSLYSNVIILTNN